MEYLTNILSTTGSSINIPVLAVIVIIYLFIISYLGWRGYKATQTAADYLVAGRGIHPYIMALSYGATFISTSAIVGFGGVAGMFGLSLLWLTFFNIFLGIFIAFVFFGKRTRRMSHHLNAHTFPEFLGKRYKSKGIQIFSGFVILLMVVYTAAVLIGAGRHLEGVINIDFDIALLIFVVITAGYVIAGGLKGVMYSDAFQGSLMFIGMTILFILAISNSGGLSNAHEKLEENYNTVLSSEYLASSLESRAEKYGFTIAEEAAVPMAQAYWGAMNEAKPNPIPSEKLAELLEGAAANTGIIPAVEEQSKFFNEIRPFIMQYFILNGLNKGGHRGWAQMPESGSPIWWTIVSTLVLGVGIGVLAQPQLSVRFMTVKSDKELNRSVLVGGVFIVVMTGFAFVVGSLSNNFFFETTGLTAIGAGEGNVDRIIPAFLSQAMPDWFNYVFLLTLLSAAMSTMSSQLHTMGTAISRDIAGALGILKDKTVTGKKTIIFTKISIAFAMVATILLGYSLPDGIIAAATAIFFGLCAAAFLPMLVGGLYWKKATRIGAIASMSSGFIVNMFWLIFIHNGTAKKIGTVSLLKGSAWADVDPLIISLPISIIVFIIVSILTAPPAEEHIETCFK